MDDLVLPRSEELPFLGDTPGRAGTPDTNQPRLFRRALSGLVTGVSTAFILRMW